MVALFCDIVSIASLKAFVAFHCTCHDIIFMKS